MKSSKDKIFDLSINNDLSISVDIGSYLAISILFFIVVFLVYRIFSFLNRSSFEFNEMELGIGSNKVKIIPNNLDVQIAYQLWVELNTRKIGIPIDVQHDVISEIYDSWYQFFGVTREMMKNIPVTKIRRKDTRKIVKLATRILNSGVREHLTQWQAKYRKWYEYEITLDENRNLTPQEIQRNYPEYDQLIESMLDVNDKLIKYKKMMLRLSM